MYQYNRIKTKNLSFAIYLPLIRFGLNDILLNNYILNLYNFTRDIKTLIIINSHFSNLI